MLRKPLPKRRHPAGAAPAHDRNLPIPRKNNHDLRWLQVHGETLIDSIVRSLFHLPGDAAFYGRERQSLTERGGLAKGT